MWFNPHAKLAEIAGQPPATSATTATKTSAVCPVSQLSQLSQDTAPQSGVADIASFVAFANFQPRPKLEESTKPVSSYGESLGGRLLTWTGLVVSLDVWRDLTEWEKRGPSVRHWNGLTRQWENSKIDSLNGGKFNPEHHNSSQ
tara:strand:+ start:215 stop:646 length:432 start_codon:yes stop_codon:yes gene_type:complete